MNDRVKKNIENGRTHSQDILVGWVSVTFILLYNNFFFYNTNFFFIQY